MTTLILVESPNKARAVAQYARGMLSGPVLVRSTGGHLRDLPADSIGVDVGNGFAPRFVVRRPKSVAYLRPYVKQAQRILLAMDPDREGEAIAWHVTVVFAPELRGKAVERITFPAITREAVRNAIRNPRPIRRNLAQAAIARRVIDRLMGYHLSPRLWAAMPGKDFSYGRVQIAALHLIAEASPWQVCVDWR